MNFYLLQGGAAAQPGGFGGSGLLFMGAIMVVFWLFFIRPQAKKAKQQKTFIEELKKGDKVVTAAGIHGKISRVNDDGTIDLEISPGFQIKMEKAYVNMEATQVLNKAAGLPVTADKK